MDSLKSDALSFPWPPVPRMPCMAAAHWRRLDSRGGQSLPPGDSDASSWDAEVWSWPRGKPLVWVNTITIQQRDTLPGSGDFLLCQNNVDTVVMITLYRPAWLESAVYEKKFFMMSHVGMINVLWNVSAIFVCVMRQYSVFITDYRTLWVHYLFLQRTC